jgi:hypothetical protein
LSTAFKKFAAASFGLDPPEQATTNKTIINVLILKMFFVIVFL